MSEAATITPANDLAGGIIASAARRKICVLTLLVGVAVGVLVGILNILADHYQWALQNDFFDIVDAPISSLKPDPFGLVSVIVSITGFEAISEATVMVCYWSVIGLFLASLVCLVRTGVFRDILRDKICKYMLFVGIFGGIFIGGLSFLAAANGWEDLENCFNSLNNPVKSVMEALQERYGIQDFLPDAGAEFIFANTVAIVYWAVIGLFMAMPSCIVRILKRRKAAREVLVVKGMIELCRGGASEQAGNEGPKEKQSLRTPSVAP